MQDIFSILDETEEDGDYELALTIDCIKAVNVATMTSLTGSWQRHYCTATGEER